MFTNQERAGGWMGQYWSPSPFFPNQQAQDFYYEYGLGGPTLETLLASSEGEGQLTMLTPAPVIQPMGLPPQKRVPQAPTPQELAKLAQFVVPRRACFFSKTGQILPQPPPNCEQVWQVFHKSVDPRFHNHALQMVSAFVKQSAAPPPKKEEAISPLLIGALVVGGFLLLNKVK